LRIEGEVVNRLRVSDGWNLAESSSAPGTREQ
jgi:hypothetical protein